MANILVTGFGPFPGVPINPTERLARGIASARRPSLAEHRIAAHVFTTSYTAVDRDLPGLLKRHRPDVLIMFGLAARAKFLRVEMLAQNRRSALHPDKDGKVAARLAIKPGAPFVMRGRAPFTRLVQAGRAAGVDTRFSRDAGRYICNYVYWRALEATGGKNSPKIVVFVHVPKLRSRSRQSARKALPTLHQLENAAAAMLVAAIAGLRTR